MTDIQITPSYSLGRGKVSKYVHGWDVSVDGVVITCAAQKGGAREVVASIRNHLAGRPVCDYHAELCAKVPR